MPSESVSIKVIAKVRPFIEEGQGKKIIKTANDKVIIEGGGKEQVFSFDYAFGPQTRPSEIYRETCDSLIQRALLGYNVTLLTLGSEGSGKTHLLSGNEDELGIVPALIKGLYGYINESRRKKDIFVTTSFVEMLDENMTDMLNPHPDTMKFREHPNLGIYIEGLSELTANTEDDLMRLYVQGNRARKMGAADIDAHRARSNGIFMINIDQKENASSKIGLRSTITVADLAGIEPDSTIVRVINGAKKGGHIPYRDSKVTRLLQQSLGGNALTMVIATLSPAEKSYQNSIQTLQLAQTARSVKNHVKSNLDETQSIIADLREEIARLRNKLSRGSNHNKEEVLKMENLVRDLQIAKKQTWGEKERRSIKFEEERKTNLANKGILEWVMESSKKGSKEIQERIILLQKEKDQLTLEYKDKRKKVDDMKADLQKRIADYSRVAESGKINESETKKRITDIHELKEKLKRETDILKDIKRKLKDVQDKQRTEKEASQGSVMVKGNAELRQAIEAEERKRQETENKALISEELDRMKIETETEKAEIQMRASQGKKYGTDAGCKMEMELAEYRAQKSVIAMQIQCLQQEKERLSTDLSNTHKRHKEELEIQQLQHFQTFRQYREMFEEQKSVLEQRYRGLLEDAVQDAVFLSTRNNELMTENQAHKQDIAELKDQLSLAEGKKPKTSGKK